MLVDAHLSKVQIEDIGSVTARGETDLANDVMPYVINLTYVRTSLSLDIPP